MYNKNNISNENGVNSIKIDHINKSLRKKFENFYSFYNFSIQLRPFETVVALGMFSKVVIKEHKLYNI